MKLREYTTLEELQALLESETEGEKSKRPENNLLVNTLKIAIAFEYTVTQLRVFGYPADDVQYIFFVEFSEKQFPFVQVRKPLSGHNIALLEEAVTLVLAKAKDAVEKHGILLVLGDAQSTEAFNRHLSTGTGNSFTSHAHTQCGVFYMDATQRDALMKENLNAPEGFTFEPIDVESDGEIIHRLWENAVDLELTKHRLRYLPSVCARNSEGEIVGWASSARFGQISMLYMKPEYRNRGAGKLLELSVAKEFLRRGMRVFKFVETTNTAVYEGTLRSPFWTLWKHEEAGTPNFLAPLLFKKNV